MSLHPQTNWRIPELTAQIAKAAFPKGNLYMKVRDHLGHIYEDADFASLFRADCGQSAYSPAQLALVSVMQFAEGLSDRQAADAVRGRLDWKYALGLELTDEGFDSSVLSEFRTRLVSGKREMQLLNTMLSQCQAQGWVKARGKARTDSTHVLAAIRQMNQVECVGETLRHALEVLAVLHPAWLQEQVSADWYERYGNRIEASRLPSGKPGQAQYLQQVGQDGHQLLAVLYADDAPSYFAQVPAVETLRQMWVQRYCVESGQVRVRQPEEMPPSAQLIQSPYDVAARNRTKRETNWTGYSVHLTETCDAALPHLITQVETTPATASDSQQTPVIHQALADKALLPAEHFADSAYASAANLHDSAQLGIDLVAPLKRDTSWQAQQADGLDRSQFQIDWHNQHVTCPAGHLSTRWLPRTESDGDQVIEVSFATATCQACPLRSQCTRAVTHPRMLKFRTQPLHEALVQARLRQATPEFHIRYRQRAGIEGTLSLACCHLGLRRSRYIGLAKTHLQNVLSATAINLSRLINWLDGIPRAQTRTTHFAALAPSA